VRFSLQTPKFGVDRILEGDAAKATGGYPGATFIIGFRTGFGGVREGPLVAKSVLRASHGYFPDVPEMRSSFFVLGPNLPVHGDLGVINMKQIAPSVAELLGVELPAGNASVFKAADTSRKRTQVGAAGEGDAPVSAPGIPRVDPDGTVQIPAFAMPPSSYMSEQAKKAFVAKVHEDHQLKSAYDRLPKSTNDPCPGLQLIDEQHRDFIRHARAMYPVDIREKEIAGVRTDVVMPERDIPARNRQRVLISLHGGGYSCYTAGGLAGQVDAIPIAGEGQFKVIAIDYRSSPRYHYPAATEDVVSVYRELLKTYRPENVGIYGSSTGATLTAASLARFQKEHLPRPGAIGLLGDGAAKDDHVDGDGWYLGHALTAEVIPGPGKTYDLLYPEAYMKGVDPHDPLVAPEHSLSVLGQFPPTILIAGTRDVGLSEVLYTERRLTEAGVQTSLHVWDGMWHGFTAYADLPESKEVFAVVTHFFDQHLGSRPR